MALTTNQALIDVDACCCEPLIASARLCLFFFFNNLAVCMGVLGIILVLIYYPNKKITTNEVALQQNDN